MKNLHLLTIGAAILVSFTACSAAVNFFTKPNMTADSRVIKVGQTATITMTAPTKAITGGDPNLTHIYTGFFYSSNLNQLPGGPPAPYLFGSKGLYAGSEPTLFPIDADLEVVSPTTGSDNVPPKVAIVTVGEQSKITFTVKGKSVGTAILRGGFLSGTVEDPNFSSRLPVYSDYDGEITIQVVP